MLGLQLTLGAGMLSQAIPCLCFAAEQERTE